MDLSRLLVQGGIALACAGAATLLIPRRIPGKVIGLILIGLAGVWLGEWAIAYLSQTYNLALPDLMTWELEGVPVIPAIVGSAVVLYIVTAFLSWGRYRG